MQSIFSRSPDGNRVAVDAVCRGLTQRVVVVSPRGPGVIFVGIVDADGVLAVIAPHAVVVVTVCGAGCAMRMRRHFIGR